MLVLRHRLVWPRLMAPPLLLLLRRRRRTLRPRVNVSVATAALQTYSGTHARAQPVMSRVSST